MKKASFVIVVLAAASSVQAVDYYYDGSGAVNDRFNWFTNTNGTGGNPTGFTANGNSFFIQNGQAPTLGGAWTISGTGSKLVISTGGSLDVGSNTPTFTLDLQSGSSFRTAASYSTVTFGTINAASTFNFAGTNGTNILDGPTYGNLTISGALSSGTTPGNMKVNGTLLLSSAGSGEFRFATGTGTSRTQTLNNLEIQSGRTLNLNNGSSGTVTSTVNLTGSLLNDGIMSRNTAGTGAITINFTGTGTSTATWGTMSAPASVSIASGRTVTFLDAFSSTGALALSNAGTLNIGDGGSAGAIQNSVNVANTGTIKFNRNNAYTYTGVISGTNGKVQQVGSGTTTLSNSQTYTGTTTISNGTLSVTGSLANTAAVSVEGGTYDVAASDTVGAVTLKSGTISGTGTLTGSSYAVESGSISAKLAGSGGLTKTTAGTVTLSGANTYTGITNVAEGTLTLASTASITSNAEVANGATLIFDTGAKLTGVVGVHGTLTGDVDVSSNVAVHFDGTLTGDAAIGGNLTVSGELSPGASPGYVLASNVYFGDSASTLMEIESLSSFDLVEAENSMSYDGALTIDISGTYAEGSSFDLFDFAGTASGDFNSISLTGDYGSALMSGAGTWTATLGSTLFTFTGSTGVLSLSAQAIPEPLTAAGVILLASRVLGRRARVSL